MSEYRAVASHARRGGQQCLLALKSFWYSRYLDLNLPKGGAPCADRIPSHLKTPTAARPGGDQEEATRAETVALCASQVCLAQYMGDTSWDEDDLGDYLIETTHRVWCDSGEIEFELTANSTSASLSNHDWSGLNARSYTEPQVYKRCDYEAACSSGTPCVDYTAYYVGWQTPCPAPYAYFRMLCVSFGGPKACWAPFGSSSRSKPGPCT